MSVYRRSLFLPTFDLITIFLSFALPRSDLDSRFRIIGTGSLHIESAKEADSGEYQCRAINSEDSLDATASLQVQVSPRFRQRPSDKKAQEKDELELVCEIDGKPTPNIHWLKNGDVITPNEYMQIVNGHNLRIVGLLPTDSGMFQCVGSNPAGIVQAAAKLQIVTPGTRLFIICVLNIFSMLFKKDFLKAFFLKII